MEHAQLPTCCRPRAPPAERCRMLFPGPDIWCRSLSHRDTRVTLGRSAADPQVAFVTTYFDPNTPPHVSGLKHGGVLKFTHIDSHPKGVWHGSLSVPKRKYGTARSTVTTAPSRRVGATSAASGSERGGDAVDLVGAARPATRRAALLRPLDVPPNGRDRSAIAGEGEWATTRSERRCHHTAVDFSS